MHPVFISGPENEDWIKTSQLRKWYVKITDDLTKEHDHTTPYPGDGGIQFEPTEQP